VKAIARGLFLSVQSGADRDQFVATVVRVRRERARGIWDGEKSWRHDGRHGNVCPFAPIFLAFFRVSPARLAFFKIAAVTRCSWPENFSKDRGTAARCAHLQLRIRENVCFHLARFVVGNRIERFFFSLPAPPPPPPPVSLNNCLMPPSSLPLAVRHGLPNYPGPSFKSAVYPPTRRPKMHPSFLAVVAHEPMSE